MVNRRSKPPAVALSGGTLPAPRTEKKGLRIPAGGRPKALRGVSRRPPRLAPRLHAPHPSPRDPSSQPTDGSSLRKNQWTLRPAPRRASLDRPSLRSLSCLILIYLTTQAVCTKSPEIDLGRTPNDLARRLGLTPISGLRGTARRLDDQLQRLVSTRFQWQYSKDFRTLESGRGLITSSDPTLELLKACFQWRKPTWNAELVLSRQFFQEITRSAVPVDLRAIELLKNSRLAIDIYIWLTHRMSYLRRPCLIPWKALEDQFGAAYSRSRDFRRSFCTRLREVVCVCPAVRLRLTDAGLLLYPSPPHVQARTQNGDWGSHTQLAAGRSQVQRVR